MNWTKVLIAGLVAGVVGNLVDFLFHGVLLADAYREYDQVFSQEPTNPAWFFLISILIALFTAILFAKTRACWASGVVGGANFGFFLGLVWFFAPFYNTLVIDGFPYFLCWVWGFIYLIDAIIFGVILGLFIKKA